MSYHFKRYQPKYKDEIVHLQSALWGPDLALNSAYLSWKYEENPYINQPLIYLALQNERVVGMRGLCGAQWEIGRTGQSVVLPCAGDTVIAQEHRNRGLLRQLLQFMHTDTALTAFPYMLNFSATAPVYFCSLSEGWRVIGAYGSLVRTAPIHGLVKSEWLESGHIQTSLEARAEEMASLIARIDRPDKICQHKDSRYFAWRFRSPLSRYQFFYWKKTTLEGFLVLSTPLTAGEIYLVDWAATNPEVLRDLLQAAVQDAGLASLMIWSATLPDTMVAILREQGFAPAKSPLPVPVYRKAVLGRCLNSALLDCEWSLAGRDVTDIENWQLCMVASDAY
jgi:hypothetical protein